MYLFAGIEVLLLLFIGLLRWKKKTIKKIGDEQLVKSLIGSFSPRLFNTKFILLSVAFAFGVLAVMNLRKPGGPDGMNRQGIDLVVALDVSQSMMATDLAPTRLDRAKQLINRLITDMPDDRIGLVLFAGKAYLQMPLTNDHRAAQLFVSTASPQSVPTQGTVVADALKACYAAFSNSDAKYKAVVLISDGEDHDEEALQQAEELATHGLMINTVGVGSTQGVHIPDALTGGVKKDPTTGADVVSRLNEEELKGIAGATNGIYVHLTDSETAVQQLKTQLSQIDKKVTGDVSLMNYTTFYWCFAGAMILLLLVDLLIPETKRKKKKKAEE